MKFFDAHSHIHGKEFDADRGDVLARMRAGGVSTITVGTHLESSRGAVLLAEKEKDVWATVGLHPTDTKEPFDYGAYKELALNSKVVAIGECGLDYFWEEDKREREKQKERFAAQIELAIEVDKPLMIHSRVSRRSMDAYEDVLSILKNDFSSDLGKLRGNVHFFTGDEKIARGFLELGFTMSFTGVITFTEDYNEVIKFLPLRHILSETDCPYVAPVPYRGKRNEPAFVVEVTEKLAEIKELPLEVVVETIRGNITRLFGI